MTRYGFRRLVRVALFAGFCIAAAGFMIDHDQVYAAGIGAVLMSAVALMIIESTAPNPKDAPAPSLPDAEDRRRWTESPIEQPWTDHVLCDRCEGRKLCPSCGGDSGCDACDGQSWCNACGGAGQWPEDRTVAIYCPAPALRRLDI